MWTAEDFKNNLSGHYQVEYQHQWHTGRGGLPSTAIGVLCNITQRWGWHFEDGELIISFEHPEDQAQALLEIDISNWTGAGDQALFYTPYIPLQGQ